MGESQIEHDIILCTHICLARNLKEIPFPWRLSGKTKKEVAEKLVEILQKKSCEEEIELRRRDQLRRERAI